MCTTLVCIQKCVDDLIPHVKMMYRWCNLLASLEAVGLAPLVLYVSMLLFAGTRCGAVQVAVAVAAMAFCTVANMHAHAHARSGQLTPVGRVGLSPTANAATSGRAPSAHLRRFAGRGAIQCCYGPVAAAAERPGRSTKAHRCSGKQGGPAGRWDRLGGCWTGAAGSVQECRCIVEARPLLHII